MFTQNLAVPWQAPEYICGAQMPDFFLDNCFVLYIKNFENIQISKSHFWGRNASNSDGLFVENKHLCNLLHFFEGFLFFYFDGCIYHWKCMKSSSSNGYEALEE